MPRKLRNDYPGAVHHVMNRGVDHQAIFFSDADRFDFGRQMATMHHRFDIDFIAYCLMGNHYHLIVRSRTAKLAEAMHFLGTTFTRRVNDRIGRDGPLFRGRYHSVPVESDLYLLWAVRYVHRNPLELPEVSSIDAYRWSSYPAYSGVRPPPSFLDTRPVTEFAGGAAELRRLTVESVPLLGSWSAAAVLELIAFVVLEQDLRAGGRPPLPRLQRTIAVLVATRLQPSALSRSILDELGFASPDARAAAVRRSSIRAADHRVASAVARVLAEITDVRAAA